VNEVTIREPVQLIDEDLDAVAGGDFNIADIDQLIRQTQVAVRSVFVYQDQTAANVASVTQVND
jgi:endonuclease V-like protein UPF0215 family